MGSLPGVNFVAIDFETANPQRASACAVGLARVRDGRVVKAVHWLMRPPEGCDDFSQRNIEIHGITARKVVGLPRFGDFLDRMLAGVGDDPLVAHNAPFDRQVFEASVAQSNLTAPELVWVDSCKLAKTHLAGLADHRLPTMAGHFGVVLDNHHDAGADAIACAGVTIGVTRMIGWDAVLAAREATWAEAKAAKAAKPGRSARSARAAA